MTIPPDELGRRINGNYVLLFLLGTAMMVPVVVWASLRWVEARRVEPPPLLWVERAQWPSPPAKPTSLEQTGIRAIIDGGGWRDPGLHLSEAEIADVRALLALVEGERFTSDETRQQIEAVLAHRPDFFYAHYLLGAWHRLHGNAREAKEHYTRAFTAAPAVIKWQYVNSAGTPMARLDVGTTEIECNQVKMGVLDSSLRLLFPELMTDEAGYVYLPVYRTVYRVTLRPYPQGYLADYPDLGWFEFLNQIGTLPPVVVREDAAAAAAEREYRE